MKRLGYRPIPPPPLESWRIEDSSKAQKRVLHNTTVKVIFDAGTSCCGDFPGAEVYHPKGGVDTFCKEQKISRVNLLRCGAEVLKGADHMLKEGRIDAVFTAFSRDEMHETLRYMDERDYKIFDIYQEERHILFYSAALEARFDGCKEVVM